MLLKTGESFKIPRIYYLSETNYKTIKTNIQTFCFTFDIAKKYLH